MLQLYTRSTYYNSQLKHTITEKTGGEDGLSGNQIYYETTDYCSEHKHRQHIIRVIIDQYSCDELNGPSVSSLIRLFISSMTQRLSGLSNFQPKCPLIILYAKVLSCLEDFICSGPIQMVRGNKLHPLRFQLLFFGFEFFQ